MRWKWWCMWEVDEDDADDVYLIDFEGVRNGWRWLAFSINPKPIFLLFLDLLLLLRECVIWLCVVLLCGGHKTKDDDVQAGLSGNGFWSKRKSGREGGTACCCCCCCNLLLFASTEDSQLSQLWCFDQRKRGGKNQTEAYRERKRN